MMKLMLAVSIALLLMMLLISHPVTFVFLMIMYTGIVAMLMSTYQNMFWYGYTLILIFLGGMLILFLYIASIAPNEKFNKIPKTKATIMSATALTLMIMSIQYMLPSNTKSKMELTMNPITSLYSTNMLMTLYLIIYLLITLLVVVKITNINGGPLRSK